MKQKIRPFWIALLLFSFVLSACTPTAPTTAPAAQPTPADTIQPQAQEATLPAATATAVTEMEKPSEEKVTLTLYTNWNPDDTGDKGVILSDAVKEFNAANPNAEIKIEVIPDTDMATKVETAFLANKEPDIILHNWLGPSKDWLADGVVVPVTQYIKDWGFEGQFKDAALDNYRVGDEVAAFPLEGFNWPMWYNMEILEKAGVKEIPTTWDEMIDVATKVRQAGDQPFALGGKDWTGGDWFFTAITAALGNEQTAELFSKGGFSNNADARAFVDAFVKMRDAKVFIDNVEGMDFDTMNAAFFAGKAAMMHGGSWSYADLPKELAGKVKLGGIPLPPNSKGATKPFWYSSFEGKGVWITRNGSKHLDLVKNFVQILYQGKYMTRFLEERAMVPPMKEVAFDEKVLSPLFVQSLKLDVDYVNHATVSYAPTSTFDAWYNVTASAFVPGTSTDDILKAMDDIYK